MILSRGRALAALAAALAARPRRAGAQSPPPIRIGTVAADTYAEGLYAVDAGFFSRAGLNVDIRVFPGSGAVAVAAAGNAVDIGLTDAVVLANATNRGVPLTVIAGCGLYAPGDATSFLCVRSGTPYQRAKDFEGAAVAVPTLVSISSIACKTWFAKQGADVGKIHFIEMPFAEMPAALERGSIAGAFVAEPILSQVPPDVKILADVYRAIGDRFLISNWFTNRDWLAKNRDVAKHLVAAIYEAGAWANVHRDQTAPILAKYAKIDPDRVRAMRRCPYATALEPRMLQPVLDAGVHYGAIERPVSASALIAKL